jgi:tRNA 2-selenouridine synthase
MTPFQLSTLSYLKASAFDTVIDVRAPSEFAEDHLPGAINLPVLTDAQRAEVGTIYTQQSPFDARKIGGALVAQNTAAHLQGPLAGKTGDWQPLVYCWRGGQRSGAFATILSQVGWRVRLLDGGYRSYRRSVAQYLYKDTLPHRLKLLSGGTGTGKTALLHHLRDAGAQVLDLEGMADHRGSLFGAGNAAQPSQKMFESRVAGALDRFDPDQIIWVEAESNKIGKRIIPPSLWSAMTGAQRIEITAPLAARADHLCRAYGDLVQDRTTLKSQIARLQPFHSTETISAWQSLAATGAFSRLAQALMQDHYDPRYAKSAARKDQDSPHFALEDLEECTLRKTAETLIKEFR